jgi:hypothetical protein
MEEVYRVRVLCYVQEDVGFIDEGWEDAILYFRNEPTQEDIHKWLRQTEVTKAKKPRIDKVTIKTEFQYVEEN